MLIKVCGMRRPENIQAVAALPVDWMGFIFYPKSPRFVTDQAEKAAAIGEALKASGRMVKRVGVFVNAPARQIMETAALFKLDYLQLHGAESPDDCYALQKRGYAVIKAFSIETADDLKQTEAYAGRADYFLFDTKCAGYGGSGRAFDWSVLQHYHGETPFLLSGGIGPDSIEALKNFSHPRCAGIDLNSGFEISPAEKDADKLAGFLGLTDELPFDNCQKVFR